MALVPELVADINQRGFGSEAQAHLVVGDDVYFSATRELGSIYYDIWKTDGTAGGTVNLTGGRLAMFESDASTLVELEGRVYFRNGSLLFVTDGTADGTLQVDAQIGVAPKTVAFKGELYYAFTDVDGQRWLGKTNGIAGGRQRISPIPAPERNGELVVAGDLLFFVAQTSPSVYQIWQSDGTAAGTHVAMIDGQPNAFYWTSNLVSMGGDLYFAADDVTHGGELWKANSSGLQILEERFDSAIQFPAYAALLHATQNYIYFTAYANPPNTQNLQLIRSDGAPGGDVVLAELTSPVAKVLGEEERLFFATESRVVWFSRGSDRDATRILASDSLGSFAWLNGNAIIPHSGAIWVSDGTLDGTQRITGFDFSPNQTQYPRLLATESAVYFSVDTLTYGEELWQTDGTLAGTHIVVNAEPSNRPSEPWYFATTESAMYFLAQDVTDLAIWSLSKETGLPTRLARFAPGWINGCRGLESVHPDSFTEAGETITYYAPEFGRYIARTDGSSEGTMVLRDFGAQKFTGNQRRLTEMVTLGDLLIFDGYDDEHGSEPWVSDGTPEGTRLLVDSAPGNSFFANPRGFTRIGDYVYFFASGQLNGPLALWRTDGTREGTTIFADLPGESGPQDIQVINDRIVFSAFRSGQTVKLWTTDGTPEGTMIFKELLGNTSLSPPSKLFKIGELAYFHAQGRLWRTDGTSDGTFSILEAMANGLFVESNGQLAFASSAAAPVGTDFWLSDGSSAGTRPVDVGEFPIGTSRPVSMPGGIAFSAQATADGPSYLWSSDGTLQGTRQLSEVPFHGSLWSNRLHTWDGDIYFQGSGDDAQGELRRYRVSSGDTNFDGEVNITDLNNVRNNFGGQGLGDTDGDGDVDISDLNAVRNNFGAGGPSPAPLSRAARVDGVASARIDTALSLTTIAPSAADNWQDALFRSHAETMFFAESTGSNVQSRRLKAVDRWFARM